MKLRWAVLVAVIGFPLMTVVVFGQYWSDTYSRGNPVAIIRLECFRPSISDLQALSNYYQPDATLYGKYILWLSHALAWQWYPQGLPCIRTMLGSSELYFSLGLLAWGLLSTLVIVYSVKKRVPADTA